MRSCFLALLLALLLAFLLPITSLSAHPAPIVFDQPIAAVEDETVDEAPAEVEAPADEAATEDEASSEEDSGTDWKSIIFGILAFLAATFGTVITAFIAKFTNQKAREAAAKAKDTELNALQRTRYEVEAIVYEVVGNLNQSEFPKIVKLVADGKLNNSAEVKTQLRNLGTRALDEVIRIGGSRGIDVVKDVGIEWVLNKIRSVVDEKSPFLGDTAESLLNGGADWLIEYGKKKLAERGVKIKEENPVPPVIPTAANMTDDDKTDG